MSAIFQYLTLKKSHEHLQPQPPQMATSPAGGPGPLQVRWSLPGWYLEGATTTPGGSSTSLTVLLKTVLSCNMSVPVNYLNIAQGAMSVFGLHRPCPSQPQYLTDCLTKQTPLIGKLFTVMFNFQTLQSHSKYLYNFLFIFLCNHIN